VKLAVQSGGTSHGKKGGVDLTMYGWRGKNQQLRTFDFGYGGD